MARLVTFEVPYDSGQFTWLQLQPKSILSLCWSGYSRWLRANLVSIPRLIREEGYGAVILDIEIRYLEPLTFFDGEVLDVSVGLKVRRRGSRLQLDVNFHGAGRHAATASIIMCPVRIEDQETLTASPAPLSPRLMAKFEPDEIDDSSPKRRIPDLVEAIERIGELLGERSGGFDIHHHYCEVAEQWSFIEVPNIVETIREPLALAQVATQPKFRKCLDNPLRRINVELYQPYFIYDSGVTETSAYQVGDELSFLHRLSSKGVGETLHGLVVESY